MSAKKIHGKKSTTHHEEKTDDPVAIVGIGASAGGLEAFLKVLNNLPVDTGMSFIFIQHLEPTHESKLSEIFSKYTHMPVQQINSLTKVKRDHIYVIPPGKYISIKERNLTLSEREKTDGLFLPIDYFFKSLAKEEKNKAIGIILSGTASDGTEGLRAIKAEGGLTFAQEQSTAKYPGMPASAIESGNVDIVLSPEKIAKELVRIGSHPYIAFTRQKEKEEESEEVDVYTSIFNKLRSVTGVDFSNYKLNTIRRRITRRMVLNKTDKIENYANLIKESKTEVHELYRDLLINVTNFFRDLEVFGMLKTKVFPEITKDMAADNPVRIWIPGCSTGEEAYSVVISLLEYLEEKEKQAYVQIFATDISDAAIDRARNGTYSEAGLKDISPDIIRKYFSQSNGAYQINKNIRDLCIFAKQDITKDPPFSRIDLISCRNLLIYFSADLQKKIIPIFHYALKPNGFLLLGTSESVGGFGDLFYLTDKKYKLYHKKQTTSRTDFNFSYKIPEKTVANNFIEFLPAKLDIQKEADKIVLDKYSPPGILINSAMEIIQFRGKVNKYLDPTIGDASLNVFRMLKETFNLDLHTAIKKARQTNDSVTIEDVPFDTNGSRKLLNLEVIPIKSATKGDDASFLILFRERNIDNDKKKENKKKIKAKSLLESNAERLRKELIATKENLQSIIEEREAANEELRSALEELQSSNEELQSANEEMETAREELQSTNEELITVNDELENRNEQLNEINNDLNNLLSSVNIPIIMLDKDLKIRRYTPRAEKVWNLISGDVGRPIGNINPNIIVPELREHILDVLENFESKEMQAKDNEGNWYSMKFRPYRTIDNKIDGVVISLYELEGIRKSDLGKNFINEIFQNLPGAILIIDNNLKMIDGNKAFFAMFGFKLEDSIGKPILQLAGDGTDNENLKKLFGEIIPNKKELKNFSYILKLSDKSDKKILLNTEIFSLPMQNKEYIILQINENK